MINRLYNLFFFIFLFFNLNSLELTRKLCTSIFKHKQLFCRQLSTKRPVIHVDHIIGSKFNADRFSVFHHDYNRSLEAKGYFHLKNTKHMASGVYHGKILRKLPNGNKIHITKTFFPSEWTPLQVLEKIHEAYNNYSGELIFTYNKAVIVSQTNEGLKIKMVITESGEILTAFPILESED